MYHSRSPRVRTFPAGAKCLISSTSIFTTPSDIETSLCQQARQQCPEPSSAKSNGCPCPVAAKEFPPTWHIIMRGAPLQISPSTAFVLAGCVLLSLPWRDSSKPSLFQHITSFSGCGFLSSSRRGCCCFLCLNSHSLAPGMSSNLIAS